MPRHVVAQREKWLELSTGMRPFFFCLGRLGRHHLPSVAKCQTKHSCGHGEKKRESSVQPCKLGPKAASTGYWRGHRHRNQFLVLDFNPASVHLCFTCLDSALACLKMDTRFQSPIVRVARVLAAQSSHRSLSTYFVKTR